MKTRTLHFRASVVEVSSSGLAVFKKKGEHNIYEAVARQKRKVEAGEALAVQRMVGAWKVAQKGIETKLAALTQQIVNAQAAGLQVSPAWLHNQERYQEFLAEIQKQIAQYAKVAGGVALQQQKAGFQLGGQHAKELVAAAGLTYGFKVLPSKQFEAMVGMLTDKSPLFDLFEQMGTGAVQKAREIFAVEIASGTHPFQIAKKIRQELNQTKTRSVLIARTESQRAYDIATRENYRANSEVVMAGRWSSSRDSHTCPLCWAKDGEIIPHDATLARHPGCRCAITPVLKYLDKDRGTGEEALAKLEAETPGYAKRVLGPARYDLWKAGKISLADLVQETDHPRWGRNLRAKNLAQLDAEIQAGATGKAFQTKASLAGAKGLVATSAPMPDLMAPNPKWVPPVVAPKPDRVPEIPKANAPSMDTLPLPKTKNEWIEQTLAKIAAGEAPHATWDQLESDAAKLYPKALAWKEGHYTGKYKKHGVDLTPPPAPAVQAATSAAAMEQLTQTVKAPTGKHTATDYLKALVKSDGEKLTAAQVAALVKHHFPQSTATADSVLHHYAKTGLEPLGGFPAGYQYTPVPKIQTKKDGSPAATKPVPPAPPVTPPPAPAPAPVDIADVILHQQVGTQKGSNPGGFYLGQDGVQRYVKFYADEGQAYGEHLANQVYARLGLKAPNTTLFRTKDGRLAYASDLLEIEGTVGQLGLDKEAAKEILGGFAADILTANWDAVGLSFDNVVRLKGGGIARIDNGGTFLYRATNGLKPEHFLKDISEWHGFAPGGKNAQYQQVFKKAGYASPEAMGADLVEQIRRIEKLRGELGGWEAYVKANTPGLSPIHQEKIAAMLDARTDLLIQKAKDIETALAKPKPKRTRKKKLPEGATGAEGFREEKTRPGAEKMRASHLAHFWSRFDAEERHAISSYKGNGYAAMNEEMRGVRQHGGFVTQKIDLVRRAFRKVLEGEGIPEDVMLFRGLRHHPEWSKLTEADIGKSINDPAFLSTAAYENFSFKSWLSGGSESAVLLRMKVPKGTKAIPANAGQTDSLGEFEYIVHGGSWIITGVTRRLHPGKSWATVTVLDVEMVGSLEGETDWVERWRN